MGVWTVTSKEAEVRVLEHLRDVRSRGTKSSVSSLECVAIGCDLRFKVTEVILDKLMYAKLVEMARTEKPSDPRYRLTKRGYAKADRYFWDNRITALLS